MKYNQSGRSMIEMLGVLAIIAVLSVGGIAGYSKALEKWKINKWVHQLEDLIFATKEAYKFDGRYGNSDSNENILPILKNIGVIPNGMLDNKNRDIFGNRLCISAKRNEINEKLLDFEFRAYPKATPASEQVCQAIFNMTTYDPDIHSIVNLEIGVWFCGKAASVEWRKRSGCARRTLSEIFKLCQRCRTQGCVTHLYYKND